MYATAPDPTLLQICTFSSTVRDRLEEWSSILEAAVNDQPKKAHNAHMYALAKISTAYSKVLDPLQQCFDVK